MLWFFVVTVMVQMFATLLLRMNATNNHYTQFLSKEASLPLLRLYSKKNQALASILFLYGIARENFYKIPTSHNTFTNMNIHDYNTRQSMLIVEIPHNIGLPILIFQASRKVKSHSFKTYGLFSHAMTKMVDAFVTVLVLFCLLLSQLFHNTLSGSPDCI